MPCARRLHAAQRCSLSWEPPKFESAKLSVRYVDTTPPGSGAASGARRRYTLTHNDLTGALLLSVGSDFNAAQVGGWCAPARRGATTRTLRCTLSLTAASPRRYTRFLRDEVLAEWADGSLHVHCHVRGSGDWWLAPRQLRDFIFRREMPLVLDTVRFADRDFLSQHAELSDAPVLVHFHDRDAHVVECWGTLNDFTLYRGKPLSALSLREAMAVSPQVDACVAAAAGGVAVAVAAASGPGSSSSRGSGEGDAPHAPHGRFEAALMPLAQPAAASRAVRQLAAVGARRGSVAAAGVHDEVLVGSWRRKTFEPPL